MNIALWIVQVLLAAAFLAHGLMFLNPPPDIAVQMNANLPRWFSLFLGVAEVAAAIGLILPGVTRIMPGLVAAAAAGVAIVVGAATPYHLVRGEYGAAVTTAVLTALAVFVLHGRLRRVPIAPRGSRP